MSRHNSKLAFLEKASLGDYILSEIPADASLRTYSRINSKHGPFVLMDCPPSYCSVEPFINIASMLRNNDILAPEVLAADIENGFLLLEDFGDTKIKDILRDDHHHNYTIYTKILEVLDKVQSIKTDILDSHSNDLLMEGIQTFTDWYIPLTVNQNEQAEHKTAMLDAWKNLLNQYEVKKNTVALRDFHVENLMLLPGDKIGVIDFQDARISHPAYDLVSLLEDARYSVSPKLSNALLEEHYGITHDKDFMHAYRILGMQRNLRILGFCARKSLRDKDNRYLQLIPRVLGYINTGLEYPALAHLKPLIYAGPQPSLG